jgi:transposase
MPCRLRKEEVVSIEVLARKGMRKTAIARALGVTEGTVRHHLRRLAEGRADGRAKRFKAETLAERIRAWHTAHEKDDVGRRRPVNVRDLYEYLVAEADYTGSYNSVRRYVRRLYPAPKIRTYRRVETPPGAQSQTDWGEFPYVDVGNGPEPLHAFVMVLSHSRKTAVVWSRREDQLSWLECHNESYRRLGGIAAVNRIDNVKTAIARGAGAWGEINPTYRSYAQAVGFHIDACSPGEANAKGKVEAKVRLGRLRLDPTGQVFDGLAHLQAVTDERNDAWAKRAICPATGLTVWESWEEELDRLAPLPILPEPFDVVVTRPVHHDCMVRFEGRQYPVPFEYAPGLVEVRGCARTVQILADGRVVREYPRHTRERILIDPTCYEGEATDRVVPPPPLGKMGRRLQEIWEMPVESRPLDLYAALAEVAR